MDRHDSATLDYVDDDLACRGHLVVPSGTASRRPGVLVFPTWKGLEDFARGQAERVARLGYVALAVDVYGEGRVASSDEEARTLMDGLAQDRPALRRRGRAALDALAARPEVDATRLGAIGYCFGGMAVLELARSGADVRAVSSFHGFLDTPLLAGPGDVKAHVEVHHGDLDPLLAEHEVDRFRAEMTAAKADWTLVVHGGAMHGFMNPAANAPENGVQFQAAAAARAWTMTGACFEAAFA